MEYFECADAGVKYLGLRAWKTMEQRRISELINEGAKLNKSQPKKHLKFST
jgi:hypothetical protein